MTTANHYKRFYDRWTLFLPLFLFLNLFIIACKKGVDVVPPVTSITSTNVFNEDATAAAVLTGIYTKMATTSFQGSTSISLFTGLSADEFTLFDINRSPLSFYYKNALSINSAGYEMWNVIYPYINVCNTAIQGLNNSTSLTPTVKQQLLGEAKYLRAFFYFYLINLYGDVPLVTGTDYTINASLLKVPKSDIYLQIIKDLTEAKDQLSTNYVEADATTFKASTERVRPNKWVAISLLARVYLYNNDPINAEAQATLVINNSTLFGLSALSTSFQKASLGNKEAIWQLQPVYTGQNTQDGLLFILPSSGPNTSGSFPVFLSNNLVNSFESGDLRKTNWIASVTPTPPGTVTYYYPNKYKLGTTTATTVTEYLMVLRLGEQYLIRAEARALQNNVSGAQADLNSIRNRAGLLNTTASTQSTLLTAILHERQAELFTEWGHRWLDLKRTNTVDAVMTIVTPTKGGTWNSNWQLYPIPNYDILTNPNLVQNPGY